MGKYLLQNHDGPKKRKPLVQMTCLVLIRNIIATLLPQEESYVGILCTRNNRFQELIDESKNYAQKIGDKNL